MVRPIMRDPLFLSRPSLPASAEDAAVIADLKDTLLAHTDSCVGMAANMIGVLRRIIVCSIGPIPLIMVNPQITRTSGPYRAEEGCLSLPGTRTASRFDRIDVTYLDEHFLPQTGTFHGFTAQIIQHEIDHCNGILI